MKKILTFTLILSLCLALSAAPAMAEGVYTPGTYTGVGSGHEEGVSVTVTVDETSITEVVIDVSHETPLIGGLAGEELAAQIGCDAAVLSETLGGVDTAYYAVPCTSWCYGTVGGLDVDINMNVLREDGTPIENLFAVGQDSEGVCNIDGKAYTPWGGQAQSWTFVSGKIAGTAAAAVAMD